MTYEDIKNKYFPLLSTEQELTLKVGDIISMLLSVADEPVEPVEGFLEEPIDRYVRSSKALADLYQNDIKTMSDILRVGKVGIWKTRGLGKTTYMKLSAVFQAHGFELR